MRELSRADQVLREAADAGAVPGVVAMAATREGPVYEGAFGRRALPTGAAMTADTVFWIASMTKAVTSTAAMQLVERGKLALDRPAREVVPELGAAQVLQGFDAAGEPKLRPPKRDITLRHLLTHTAGFGYDIWSPDLIRYQEKKGVPGIITCQNLALTTPLLFDPGERWNYGINIDWVGKAVERASGQNLEAYLRDNILAPLGMRDTGFRLDASRRSRLAGMHARQPDGSLQEMPFELPQEPEFFMGGGGLYGTAGDYLKFQQMFLHEGRLDGVQVLEPDTVRLMARNHIGELDVLRLETAMPPYSNDAEFFPGMVKKWGLGFMINSAPVPDRRGAGSLAWAGLGNTYFWIDPGEGVAGVILTQIIPFADAKVLDLFARFEAAVHAALH
jgi:CubicO group peptidase (beta-lactamase class C family)